MELDISDIESSAHQNFLDYIRNEKTRKKYDSSLHEFLNLIPTKIYQDNDIAFIDKTEAFVILTKNHTSVSKSIINAYVRELKKNVESNFISASTLLNKLKPIKALFASNDIDFSWTRINKSLPKPGKSKD